mmetsp:Transcript_19275/g.48992  ORF Transcript_19275/g.48992 Transcript_19275/m.48992 type:complete len:248 (-) Transcript_19275:695-1438(-)
MAFAGPSQQTFPLRPEIMTGVPIGNCSSAPVLVDRLARVAGIGNTRRSGGQSWKSHSDAGGAGSTKGTALDVLAHGCRSRAPVAPPGSREYSSTSTSTAAPARARNLASNSGAQRRPGRTYGRGIADQPTMAVLAPSRLRTSRDSKATSGSVTNSRKVSSNAGLKPLSTTVLVSRVAVSAGTPCTRTVTYGSMMSCAFSLAGRLCAAKTVMRSSSRTSAEAAFGDPEGGRRAESATVPFLTHSGFKT